MDQRCSWQTRQILAGGQAFHDADDVVVAEQRTTLFLRVFILLGLVNENDRTVGREATEKSENAALNGCKSDSPIIVI